MVPLRGPSSIDKSLGEAEPESDSALRPTSTADNWRGGGILSSSSSSSGLTGDNGGGLDLPAVRSASDEELLAGSYDPRIDVDLAFGGLPLPLKRNKKNILDGTKQELCPLILCETQKTTSRHMK